MQMTYSATVDAVAVRLAEPRGKVMTREVAPGVLIDIDRRGRVTGIEVLNASARYSRDSLERLASPAEWVRLVDAAAEVQLSPITLRTQISAGRLRAEKRGRDWYVARHDLMNYLENRAPSGRRSASRRRTAGAR